METKTLRTIALEMFKTLNSLKPVRDSNGIWTHNHLVRKRILNPLAKLAKVECSFTN